MLIAIVTGLTSGVATVITLKTDINWIKKIVEDHGKRLSHMERKHNG